MKYRELTADNQKAMLKDRVRQLETEHYQHGLNAAVLNATPDPVDEAEAAALAASRKHTADAMTALDAAHLLASAEYDKLDK